MSGLFLPSPRQMSKIEPFFPRSHGGPRVDDRRVVSGIIYVLKPGLQWKDAPRGYGPHKTLYARFRRWMEMGGFDRIFSALTAENGLPDTLMIEATQLKAHRTACSLLNGSVRGKAIHWIAFWPASTWPYRAHKRGGMDHETR